MPGSERYNGDVMRTLILLWWIALPLMAQPAEEDPAPPGHRDVEEIRLLVPDAGRVAWSTQGDRIAFDRPGAADGFYDVWVAEADGTGQRCLTCDLYELRKADVLNPAWHPSGDSLAVQVLRLKGRGRPTPTDLAGPGRGVTGEMWILPAQGRQVYRISPEQGNRMDPHFSHEGGRILWTERLHGGGGWGEWGVLVADLKLKRGIPRMGKVKQLQPGPGRGLIVGQGFTPDDQGFLFLAGNRLFRSGFSDDAWRPLADGSQGSHHVARHGPVAGRLVWDSERNVPSAGSQSTLPYRSDLWLAVRQGDGLRQERLTFFNDPDSDHFLGEALIDDVAWSPEGDRLLVHVVHAGSPQPKQGVYLIVLDESYRR